MSDIISQKSSVPHLKKQRWDRTFLNKYTPSLLAQRLLLLLAILLAFGLRVYRLDAQSLWYDEGVTAMVAQLDFGALTRWTARDIQPPLYYYVVAAWGNLTDWREWHLRWPSVWFGVLTVPLMAVLVGCMTRGQTAHSQSAGSQTERSQTAVLLAAFFAAIHPLLLYYSQEARMYAMLTALVILCGLLLMRQAHQPSLARQTSLALQTSWSGWFAYVLAATAAVYTHYFAFFLLLAIGLAYLFFQPQFRPFLLANLAILVLYIPWFGALFTRLVVDSSFLPGQVKLNELVRHILTTFIAGETILETQAERALGAFALVTVVAIFWLAWRAVNGAEPARKALILGLCWVLIPCTMILSLTLAVPKFNARYVMIALPGLLLLWSVAIGDMLAQKNFGRYFALGITLVLVTNFTPSIRNWFRDDAFTKAQWRELAQHVREHKTDDEAVILVSGHAWPIWNYYAPDMPPVRLPNLEILDVNATLDYTLSGSILRTTLADQQGAWLVRWQDQFVDPMGTAALHLERAATRLPTDAEFWQLQLSHFTNLRAEQIYPYPPTAGQGSVNFGNQLVLLGHTTNAHDDLLLYWTLHENFANGTNSLADLPDYRIAGELRTMTNLPYHRLPDQRPVAYEFPTTRWQPGQINVSRIPAIRWAGSGALPDEYQLALSVYDSLDKKLATLDILAPNGMPLGKQALLSVPLNSPILWDDGTVTGLTPLSAALAGKVLLSSQSVEPGEPIRADIRWRVSQPQPDADTLQIQWRGQNKLFEDRLPLASVQSPFHWPPNEPASSSAESDDVHVHTVHALRVPNDALPGDYTLSFSIEGDKERDGKRDKARDEAKDEELQTMVSILPSTRTFEPPALARPIGVVFGNEVELLGVIESSVVESSVVESSVIESSVVDESQSLITLAWRATTVPRADYFATVQILNAQGQPILQSDLALPRGSSNWLPGQVETQEFVLNTAALDPTMNDSPLLDSPLLDSQRVIVAVYHAQNGFQRLPLPSGMDYVVLR